MLKIKLHAIKKTMDKTCGIWWNDKECRKGCFIKGFMLKHHK